MVQPTTNPGSAEIQAPAQQPIREAIDDGVVTAKLRARLARDPVTKPYLIQVETFHGTVIVSGYVEFATVRNRVLQIANEVAGGNQVKDATEIHDL